MPFQEFEVPAFELVRTNTRTRRGLKVEHAVEYAGESDVGGDADADGHGGARKGVV